MRHNEESFDQNIVAFSHITCLVTTILGPLLIWLFSRDSASPETMQGLANVLNMSISYMIYTIIASFLVIFLIGIILLPIVLIADFIVVIIGIIRTLNGELYEAPFTIQFIK